MTKKLSKSNTKKIFAGVCGGIAEYFNIDPNIIRLILCIVTIFSVGAGVVIYIVACILMPSKSLAEEDAERMRSANIQEEDSSSEKKSGDSKSGFHSDSEFNSYFEK